MAQQDVKSRSEPRSEPRSGPLGMIFDAINSSFDELKLFITNYEGTKIDNNVPVEGTMAALEKQIGDMGEIIETLKQYKGMFEQISKFSDSVEKVRKDHAKKLAETVQTMLKQCGMNEVLYIPENESMIVAKTKKREWADDEEEPKEKQKKIEAPKASNQATKTTSSSPVAKTILLNPAVKSPVNIQQISIGNGLTVQANVVNQPSECKNFLGLLCFSKPLGVFSISIGVGQMICGGLCNIFYKGGKASKVNEHQDVVQCKNLDGMNTISAFSRNGSEYWVPWMADASHAGIDNRRNIPNSMTYGENGATFLHFFDLEQLPNDIKEAESSNNLGRKLRDYETVLMQMILIWFATKDYLKRDISQGRYIISAEALKRVSMK